MMVFSLHLILDSFACGVADVAGRIVGGGEADPNSIPWQVGLVSNGGSNTFCGGTIITPYHILTAAHCTSGTGSTTRQVIAGEHDLLTTADKATRHDIAHVLDHPLYNTQTNTNYDYSILTLTTPINLGVESHARYANNTDICEQKILVLCSMSTTFQGCLLARCW